MTTRYTISNDYYPFGSPIKSRTFSSGAYRYGFNGKEKDDEINGSGNAYDFGARIYDGRLGRWLSVDPLASKYPSNSSYNAFDNNPIYFTDIDGKDAVVTIKNNTITISTTIQIYGKEATNEIASKMQADILKAWDKPHTFTDEETGEVYNVKFNVTVKLYNDKERSTPLIIPESWNPLNTDNFVKIENTKSTTHVSGGDEGVWSSKDMKNTGVRNVAAHEFGHLLGLDDKYKESKKDGKRYTPPIPGWEGNIMATSSGVVEQKNINALAQPLIAGYKEYKEKREEIIRANKANLNASGQWGVPYIHNEVPPEKYVTKIDDSNPSK